MLSRFFNKIKFYMKPYKPGDIYYANPTLFVIGKPMEQVLHGLKDKMGNNIFIPIPSKNCYRLTIVSISDDTVTYLPEVFCRGIPNELYANGWNNIGYWMKRVQNRKMPKPYFKELLFNGTLTR